MSSSLGTSGEHFRSIPVICVTEFTEIAALFRLFPI
jgi:hypothetical protein